MSQDIRKYMSLVEARRSLDDMDEVDKRLYDYVHNESGWPGDMDRLHRRYPLDTPIFCFRGLNFSTKEDYEEFLAKVNAGPVEIGSSSWTAVKSTGEDFAQHKKTYNLSMMVALAHDAYEKSKEAIHGYKGVLLGMFITPEMNAVDVRKFSHGAEDEILLPGGTYELKIIKTYSKFSDTIEPNDASKRFLSAKRDSREYEYLLKNYKDQFNDAARIKLFNDLFGFKRSTGSLYSSEKEKMDSFLREPSTYFTHTLSANVFPAQAIQLALEEYFPEKYNELIIKMANKSLDRFAADYGKDEKTVMDKWRIANVGHLFELLGRSHEFTQLQAKKFSKPYQHMQGDRVKQINAIKDPKEHAAAMRKYMDDLEDIFSRI